jgi:hypothetical protein
MPRYLDAHPLGGLDEKTLKQLQNSPPDEFGIKHVNIFYNKSENKSFCLLDAPNKEAVEKHHEKAGFKCDWIIEVESTSEL